jgi:AraC family transcriptional regulator
MYLIVDKNEIKPAGIPLTSNVLMYSMVQQFYAPLSYRNFSIKYVTAGRERYTINKKEYIVRAGEYLLVNDNNGGGTVLIDDVNTVKGICIGLQSSIVADAVASFREPGTAYPDQALNTFFNTPGLLDDQYHSSQTKSGAMLAKLGAVLDKDPYEPYRFDLEFYFELAACVVADQAPVCKQLQTIGSVKPATKKDLLKRLQRGKAFIDQCYSASIDTAAISREAQVSEYHFYRLFKAVYGLSPHQYLIRKRLEAARRLLLQKGATVSEAAYESGFADIYTFSKAFKKHFAVAPSAVLKK